MKFSIVYSLPKTHVVMRFCRTNLQSVKFWLCRKTIDLGHWESATLCTPYLPFSFSAPFSIIIFLLLTFSQKSILLILSYIFSHTLTYFHIFWIQKFHILFSSLLPHQNCLLWCWQRFVSFVNKWENYFCCIPVLRLWWWLVGGAAPPLNLEIQRQCINSMGRGVL